MRMSRRAQLAVVAAAGALVLGASAATAAALAATGGAQQVTGPDVYACVNPAGGIDYLEFRLPIPHPCWHVGEQLWRWSVNPVPGPTITATAG